MPTTITTISGNSQRRLGRRVVESVMWTLQLKKTDDF
jgi:hypothetical protein